MAKTKRKVAIRKVICASEQNMFRGSNQDTHVEDDVRSVAEGNSVMLNPNVILVSNDMEGEGLVVVNSDMMKIHDVATISDQCLSETVKEGKEDESVDKNSTMIIQHEVDSITEQCLNKSMKEGLSFMSSHYKDVYSTQGSQSKGDERMADEGNNCTQAEDVDEELLEGADEMMLQKEFLMMAADFPPLGRKEVQISESIQDQIRCLENKEYGNQTVELLEHRRNYKGDGKEERSLVL